MIDVTFLLLIYFCVRDVNDSGAKLKLPIAANGVAVSELQSVVFTVAASEGARRRFIWAMVPIPAKRCPMTPNSANSGFKPPCRRGSRKGKKM